MKVPFFRAHPDSLHYYRFESFAVNLISGTVFAATLHLYTSAHMRRVRFNKRRQKANQMATLKLHLARLPRFPACAARKRRPTFNVFFFCAVTDKETGSVPAAAHIFAGGPRSGPSVNVAAIEISERKWSQSFREFVAHLDSASAICILKRDACARQTYKLLDCSICRESARARDPSRSSKSRTIAENAGLLSREKSTPARLSMVLGAENGAHLYKTHAKGTFDHSKCAAKHFPRARSTGLGSCSLYRVVSMDALQLINPGFPASGAN